MTILRTQAAKSYRETFLVSCFCILVVFCVLFLRLSYLQIWKGKTFKNLSENNRIRLQEIHAPRGRILDAAHQIIVDNRPCFDVTVIPEEIRDYDLLEKSLAPLAPWPPDVLNERLSELKKATPFRSYILWKDAAWDTMAYLEANRLRMPGVVIQVGQARDYLFSDLFAHVLGYMGEINTKELARHRNSDYRIGEWIGKVGVEKYWEKYLRGKKGGVQVEVDARGRQISVLRERRPTPGKNVVLSLYQGLQQKARDAFEDYTGVAVAVDPRDGSVLCYLNLPSYDPNSFVMGISQADWDLLSTDPYHPLTNRVIQGMYPPGSVFMIFFAIAALEEGVVTPREKIFCSGKYSIGARNFRCWKKYGHAHVDLHQALVESCDVYFYQVGLRLGIEKIHFYSHKFGLGEKTRIRLGNEKSGLVPNIAWKKKRFGVTWYDGETLNASIGQGFLLTTPMQVVMMVAAVANGGNLWKPRLIQRIEGSAGKVLENPPQLSSTMNISSQTMSLVKNALRDVVHSKKGTGKRARLDYAEVAGKTGTAQVIRLAENKVAEEDIPRERRDHAWFACYAPADSPEIAVVVLVEHGGHGGETAAPIAKQIMDEYFRIKGKGEPLEPL